MPIKVINGAQDDLAAALVGLRRRLQSEIVSERSQKKTLAVFGAALTPAQVVKRIIADVRAEGDPALVRYTQALDGVALPPSRFRVSREEIRAARASVEPALIASLECAIANVRAFQTHIKPRAPRPWKSGAQTVAIRQLPLQRVAVYVPRGAAAYPSCVIMSAVPAQVAGVKEVVVLTPPEPDGTVAPAVLAACSLLKIDEIYRLNAPAGIAALAYGTGAIEPVQKIVGPGNLFVTLAKKEVFGEVGIDILAGPSEILVIADETARPDFVAADMLSQAEHAPGCAIVLSPSEEIIARTRHELELQLSGLATEAAARFSLKEYGLAGVTRSIEEAVELANQFAPEHLELCTTDAAKLLKSVRNAGAVFLGPYTPEPVGDYIAGPSHVLPTSGAARFLSGLSVRDFLRTMSVIAYDEAALAAVAPDVVRLAESEGLCAHARSVLLRFETKRRR